MKKILTAFISIILSTVTTAQQTEKPNIILIFADDLGYKDAGFTGSKIVETPNLDALAKQGMVFNNAYAGAGNCAPSRACLLSGRYTPRHGVYAVGSTTRGPKKEMKVVPVPNTNYLASSFVTVAEALQKQGYATGLFGKWHLSSNKTTGTAPTDQGFDVFFDSRKDNPNKKRDEPKDPKGIYSLTDSAIAFMQHNQHKPFFTFLSHHAIHSNIEAKPSTIERFKQKGLDGKTALYAACIYDLDESIGILMAYLKKSGLDKNTLVIFTSDNGATQQSSQEPLRGNKGGYYEGGIREPFIAYWKDNIKPNTQNNTPIINIDLYATFLAAAGNTTVKTDGENLLPLFKGKASTTKRTNLYWHFPGYLNDPVIRGRDSIFRTRPVTVLRKGDWKIHLYYEEWLLNGGMKNIDNNNAVELYNLKNDEGERTNLSLTNRTKRNELLSELLAWLRKEKVPQPVPIDKDHPLNDSDGGAEDN
ncbi:sulfatase [Lacibacter sp.]|uniref:sulfatase n=1 Tax=Lacibacter sp. TaxID=1915409 RepID=UPI002B4AE158|nr:sulfatase [Lacibacter sp.]HLP37692.1 sulfatase [Lacibacter sp.]